MVVRSVAAPPTPWSKHLAEPEIDETAYVHSFSNIIGDVRIGANVLVAPGTSIRADEGHPFKISDGTNIQDGVVIHGLEQGRVIGDDGQNYSVWIGKNASITHMALIHGPAYVGEECFIGFRSTVFNARVGKGCIVMMHVLIKDVEIPAGKYVPSGSIITNQKQADRLPDVQDTDLKFARHVVGINDALRTGYRCAEDLACVTQLRDETGTASRNGSNGKAQMLNTRLSTETVEQVRQLLAQGYKIGMEHADQRRFRTGSWKSCTPVDSNRESDVFAGLEACLDEHQGEYVRLIGIDTKAKRRVLEAIIQRPGDSSAPRSSAAKSPATNGYSPASGGGNGVGADVSDQVRQLIAQGYKIGTEFADQRRFRTGSWTSGPTIQTRNAAEAIAVVESALADHAGQYVRLIGIDPQAKRRVLEQVIHRPGDRAPQASRSSSAKSNSSSYSAPSSSYGSNASSSALSQESIDQIRNLLAQGYKIGTEHADKRRFRTGSWNSCAPIESKQVSEVVRALEDCLANHDGEYVRMIGIDPQAKRRVSETIIQRPA